MTSSKVFLATTGEGIARANYSADGGWSVQHLLQGESVRCLTADPQDSRVVYAGTHGKGVFRSTDRGLTWKPTGMTGQIVKSLAVSPHDSKVIYAGMKPAGIYITRDSGASWLELDGFQRIRGRRWWRSPAEPPDWRAYVMAIAISPTDPNVVVAGIEFGAVVRTSDAGETWSNHLPRTNRDCHGLKFHPRDGNWVYQSGASFSGPAFSRDGGRTWQRVKQGMSHHYGWTNAADPVHPEVWYVSAGPMGWRGTPQAHVDGAANAAIYRKSGGAPWQRLGGGLPQPLDYMAYALVSDAERTGHLYAGLSNGDVWRTEDYGDNWHKLPFNLRRIFYTMIIV